MPLFNENRPSFSLQDDGYDDGADAHSVGVSKQQEEICGHSDSTIHHSATFSSFNQQSRSDKYRTLHHSNSDIDSKWRTTSATPAPTLQNVMSDILLSGELTSTFYQYIDIIILYNITTL